MRFLTEQIAYHYNIIFFLVIPALAPAFMFFIGRKLLWISPFLSFAFGLLITYIAFPNIFIRLLTGREELMSGAWLFMTLPIHVFMSVAFTVIGYGATYIVSKRQRIE